MTSRRHSWQTEPDPRSKNAQKSVRDRKNASRKKSAGRRRKRRSPVLRARKARRIPTSPESFPDRNRRRGATKKSFEPSSRPIPHASWAAKDTRTRRSLAPLLEQGAVVFLPNLPFAVEPAERDIFSPAILSSSKNTSYDPLTDRVGGTTLSGAPREQLRGRLHRFSGAAASLVDQLFPEYRGQSRAAARQFPPGGNRRTADLVAQGRHATASRRLPASPTRGDRILRVFERESRGARPHVARRRGGCSSRGTICVRAIAAVPGGRRCCSRLCASRRAGVRRTTR